MADDSRIEVQIVLDDGSIKKGFVNIEKGAEKSAKKVGKSFQTSFKSFGKTLAIGAAAATAAVAGLALALRPAVAAALESESALTKFNLTLANAGKFSQEASNSFADFANELQTQTGISNDLITTNASLLVSMGKLSGEGLERATEAAVNLSKGLNKDLRFGFDLVAKAASGNASQLKTYGITVDTTKTQSEQLAEALDLIEGQYADLAKTIADGTFEGALGKVSASFGEVEKAVGKFIVQSPVIREALLFLSESFDKLTEFISSKTITKDIDNLILKLLEFSIVVNQKVFKPIGMIVEAIVLSFKAVAAVVNGAIAFAAKAASEIIRVAIAPVITFITDKVGGLVNFFDRDLGSKIKTIGANAAKTIETVSSTLADSTGDVFVDSLTSTLKTIDSIFQEGVSETLGKYLVKLRTALVAARQTSIDYKNGVTDDNKDLEDSFISLENAFGSMTAGFSEKGVELRKNAVANFRAVGAAARTTLAGGLGQAFAAAGQAFAKGENALEAFGKTMLGIFGDIAIQLGTQFILQGTGWSVNPPTLGSGAPLIAAGAALATFGGVLKAASGSGGISGSPPAQATGGTGGGGGLTTSPDDFGNIAETEFPEIVDPGPRIEVNIAGDVLDSDESALRIVDLINSAFDKQGVTVTA